MNSKAIKLNGRFNSMKIEKTKSKNQTLEGPLKMIDTLSGQVKDYMKFNRLIRVFSNPGMK